jgi:hypothetical protein
MLQDNITIHMSQLISPEKMREKIQNLRAITRIQKKRGLVSETEPFFQDQAPIPTPLTKQEREAVNEKMEQLQSIGVNQAITQAMVEQTDQSRESLNKKVEALRDYTSLTGVTIQPEEVKLFGFGREWLGGIDLEKDKESYLRLLTQVKIPKADVKSISNIIDKALRSVPPNEVEIQRILQVSKRLTDLNDRLDVGKAPVGEVNTWTNLKEVVLPKLQEFLDALPNFWEIFGQELDDKDLVRIDRGLTKDPSKRQPLSGINAPLAGTTPKEEPSSGVKREVDVKDVSLKADEVPKLTPSADLLQTSLSSLRKTPPPRPKSAPSSQASVAEVLDAKLQEQETRKEAMSDKEFYESLTQKEKEAYNRYLGMSDIDLRSLISQRKRSINDTIGYPPRRLLRDKIIKNYKKTDRVKILVAHDQALGNLSNDPDADVDDIPQRPSSTPPSSTGNGVKRGQGFTKVSSKGEFGQLRFDMDKFYKMQLHAKKHGKNVAKGPLSHDLFLLLTKRFNPKHDYSEESLDTFKRLVDLAELPKLSAQCGKGKVLKGIIKPKKTPASLPLPQRKRTKFVYYDKPEELLERLNIVMGSIDSGNNSDDLREEASQLLDVLKSKEVISKIQYESLMESLM